MVRGVFLIYVIFFFGFTTEALAGRRAYSFMFDAETLNEGDFELEEWLTASRSNSFTSTSIWFSPIYGVTRHLEIAVPWSVHYDKDNTFLKYFNVEARIRLYEVNNRTGLLYPYIRIAAQLNINNPENLFVNREIPAIGTNFVLAFGHPEGSHATIDIATQTVLRFDDNKFSLHDLGLGYVQVLSKKFRVSLEYKHSLSLVTPSTAIRSYRVGPNLSYARGQVWATLGCLIGLTSSSPDYQARFQMGVSI